MVCSCTSCLLLKGYEYIILQLETGIQVWLSTKSQCFGLPYVVFPHLPGEGRMSEYIHIYIDIYIYTYAIYTSL